MCRTGLGLLPIYTETIEYCVKSERANVKDKLIKVIFFTFILFGLSFLAINYYLLFFSNHKLPEINALFYIGIFLNSIIFLGSYIYLSSQIIKGLIYPDNRWSIFIIILLFIVCINIMIVAYADIYKRLGLLPGDTHDPWTALYFSIVTWTTLGYGDFKPSEPARLIASFEALLGYIFMGCFIAFLFHALFKIYKKD